MVEVGLIHPPVGMNLFVIQAQAPDVKITASIAASCRSWSRP